MTIRPATHRPSGLARRDSLLDAAVELVAERGVAGVTHRGVAERAGLPSSTTSYFFASIEDLVLEALRVFAARSTAAQGDLAAAFDGQEIDADEFVDQVAALLVATPSRDAIAQIEAYCEAARRPDLAGEVHAVMDAFAATAEAALRSAGVADPRAAARTFHALADGFMLHRVAWPRGDADQVALRDGMTALLRGYLSR
jgi:DNA-binding transcriptional regulator YbjK